MVRIIKFENKTEKQLNDFLTGMQNGYHAQILGIQCYGKGDCYMVVYECDNELNKEEIVSRYTSVPLD